MADECKIKMFVDGKEYGCLIPLDNSDPIANLFQLQMSLKSIERTFRDIKHIYKETGTYNG